MKTPLALTLLFAGAFIDDIRLPLSNNEAERTILHAVLGRKNYHGSNNHTGAETAATHFTIIESCKKNEIDPREFILMSLKRIAAGKPVMTPLEYAKHLRLHGPPAPAQDAQYAVFTVFSSAHIH